MSTFKSLKQDNILTGEEKCNLRGLNTPDGCWALQNDKLGNGHVFCVEYSAAVEDLPKLIIDSYINKYGKKPDAEDFAEIVKTVVENMKIAINQGRI